MLCVRACVRAWAGCLQEKKKKVVENQFCKKNDSTWRRSARARVQMQNEPVKRDQPLKRTWARCPVQLRVSRFSWPNVSRDRSLRLSCLTTTTTSRYWRSLADSFWVRWYVPPAARAGFVGRLSPGGRRSTRGKECVPPFEENTFRTAH